MMQSFLMLFCLFLFYINLLKLSMDESILVCNIEKTENTWTLENSALCYVNTKKYYRNDNTYNKNIKKYN